MPILLQIRLTAIELHIILIILNYYKKAYNQITLNYEMFSEFLI